MARDYPLSRYRNFGIMAHIDAGTDRAARRRGRCPQRPPDEGTPAQHFGRLFPPSALRVCH